MTKKWLVILGITFLTCQCSGEPTSLKTPQEKVSYGIGVSVAKNMKKQGVEVDINLLAKGMKDEFAGKLLISPEELQTAMNEFQAQLRQKQTQGQKTAAEANIKEGTAFLEENKKKEGVVVLPSGLQYKILKAGDGKKPTDTDTVEVHYRGTLINGTEFDSSLRKGQPITFKVNGVIPGWTEALKLMPAGSKWQLFIPSKLAYGERGSHGTIGPNATLIFEVELLNIKETPKEEKKAN